MTKKTVTSTKGTTQQKAKKKASPRLPQHSVYVIELDDAVRLEKKFQEKNPGARLDKPCLYVGMTGLTPEERFANHKAGKKSSLIVKKHGIRLRPRYFEDLNPMTYEEAKAEEPALAARLRKRGFAVWQN